MLDREEPWTAKQELENRPEKVCPLAAETVESSDDLFESARKAFFEIGTGRLTP